MKTNAFVKQLASNNKKTRDHALETLKKFLSSREKSKPLSLIELKKLWKGLYYTMWFSDRPRPQQRLANDLASLFSHCVVDEQFMKFVESFWYIINKEWHELDKWRVDKFYMLMRYVIRECFVKLKESDWDHEYVDGYMEVLSKNVLNGDMQIPNGVVYHIIDIWVDEFERVVFASREDEEEDDNEDDEDDEDEKESDEERIKVRKAILEKEAVPVDKLLEPFKKLLAKEFLKPLRKKIREEILEDNRLIELDIDLKVNDLDEELADPEEKNGSENEDDDEEEEEEEEEDEEEEEWTGFGN